LSISSKTFSLYFEVIARDGADRFTCHGSFRHFVQFHEYFWLRSVATALLLMRILMAIAVSCFGETRSRASFKIVKHLIVYNGYGHMFMFFALFLSVDVLADRQRP
jgi:hypothetical protein